MIFVNKEKEVERLKELEKEFSEINATLAELDKVLHKVKKQMPKIKNFDKYYSSEEWFKHREMLDEGYFDELETTAILGEDYPYDTVFAIRNQAIEMLEIATELLK